MLRSIRGGGSVADAACIRTVFHVRLPIGGNRTEVKVSQMPPTLEHDPSLEWLALGGHDDAIVFAPRVRIVFAPVQFEALKPQRIDSDEEILGPLVAVTALPKAMVNEEIVENRRAKHAVFPPKLGHGGECAVRQQLCFLPIHSQRK